MLALAPRIPLVGRFFRGAEARAEGGYGLFDYRAGAPRQIWIAGSIGLTPFLSWIRNFDQQPGCEINFYYTVRYPEDALFLDEIKTTQAHLHCSNSDGRLSVEKIASSSGPVSDKEIYLCGPIPMIAALKKQFLQAGVSCSKIHNGELSFRYKTILALIFPTPKSARPPG